MAQVSGTRGFVKVGATEFAFDKWRAALRSGTPKVTNFTGGGAEQNVAGVVGATLTLSGAYDPGNMPFTLNVVYTFVLGADTGVQLSVPARVAAIELDNSVEDAPRVSLTANSTGAFTAAIA